MANSTETGSGAYSNTVTTLTLGEDVYTVRYSNIVGDVAKTALKGHLAIDAESAGNTTDRGRNSPRLVAKPMKRANLKTAVASFGFTAYDKRAPRPAVSRAVHLFTGRDPCLLVVVRPSGQKWRRTDTAYDESGEAV